MPTRSFPSLAGGPAYPGAYCMGNACPICGGPVSHVDEDVAGTVPGEPLRVKIGGPGAGAVLLPCGHYVARVLGPGNAAPGNLRPLGRSNASGVKPGREEG